MQEAYSLEAVSKHLASERGGGKVVLAGGTFDILHVGHARYLETVKGLGDMLVVGITSDEKVRSRKGDSRPIVPEFERAEMVAHLRHVDHVFISREEFQCGALQMLKPAAVTLTSEPKVYESNCEWVEKTKAAFPGIEFVFVPLHGEGVSTSGIIARAASVYV